MDDVATNPLLMAREGMKSKNNIFKHYVHICNMVNGDTSVEVMVNDFDGLVREGEELTELHEQLVVKFQ